MKSMRPAAVVVQGACDFTDPKGARPPWICRDNLPVEEFEGSQVCGRHSCMIEGATDQPAGHYGNFLGNVGPEALQAIRPSLHCNDIIGDGTRDCPAGRRLVRLGRPQPLPSADEGVQERSATVKGHGRWPPRCVGSSCCHRPRGRWRHGLMLTAIRLPV